MFVDLGNSTPSMTFFSLKDVPHQDAKGIGTASRQASAEHDLSYLVFSVCVCVCVCFVSDSASVNSGIKFGLITQFPESGLHWATLL